MIFQLLFCDLVASTGVLRFVGPNSIRVWCFQWNSGCDAFNGIVVIFNARILFFWYFSNFQRLV